MNKKINKKFFIISLTIHLFIFLMFYLFNSSENEINKRFLVFGAHSKIPTYALFKSNKNLKTTNWLAKRQAKEKQIQEKKAFLKKQKQKIRAPKPVIKQTKKTTPKKKSTSLREAKKQAPPRKIQNKKENKKIKLAIKNKIKAQEEIHFNLMGESNPQLIKFQKSIQKEVARLWKPPVGVPKGTECSVMFSLNNKGNVEDFEILNKSDILIYDLSILRVARRFKFNKFLWGKKISIDFIQ